MELLLIVLIGAFVSGLRRSDREVPVPTVPLVLICIVIAIGYLSQRVI